MFLKPVGTTLVCARHTNMNLPSLPWWWMNCAHRDPYPSLSDDVFLDEFPGNCSASVLLQEIQPSDGNVDWFPLLFYSGAAAALLLQFMLANWFISWFTMLRPLTICRGRIMLP